MAKVALEIDDVVFEEAKEILESLGLNIGVATNIFLRRVVIEKGLPLSMNTSPVNTIHPNVTESEDEIGSESASYTKISKEMVEEVWKAFLKNLNDLTPINELSLDLSKRTGMNWGSAAIYLNFILNLVNAAPNNRTMKMKDLEFFLDKIKTDLGEEEFQQGVKSLQLSIPYWRANLPGRFADKVEVYCKNNAKT